MKYLYILLLLSTYTSCNIKNKNLSYEEIEVKVYSELIPDLVINNFNCFRLSVPIPPTIKDTLIKEDTSLIIYVFDSLNVDKDINPIPYATINSIKTIQFAINFLKNGQHCRLNLYKKPIDENTKFILLKLSRIYFNHSFSEGVFTLIVYKDADDATKYVYFIRKQEDKWKIYDSKILWKA